MRTRIRTIGSAIWRCWFGGARLDFKAELTWIDPTAARKSGANEWDAVNQAAGEPRVPQ